MPPVAFKQRFSIVCNPMAFASKLKLASLERFVVASVLGVLKVVHHVGQDAPVLIVPFEPPRTKHLWPP